jgi:Domain of unknown function (DUF4260)
VIGPSRTVDLILRLEALALFIGGVLVFLQLNGQPLWLLPLLLAPDLSMIGYLAGPRVGAACYDAVHAYVAPVVLSAAGLIAGADLAIQLGLIWLTHIGVDRAVGYGLKYPTHFKDTHLQRV